jgi:hypothetical protein
MIKTMITTSNAALMPTKIGKRFFFGGGGGGGGVG